MKCLILGATGLIGSNLLEACLRENLYDEVRIITRRKLNIIKSPKVVVTIDQEFNLEGHRELFQVDHVYCCLGTTIKQAKSKERFKAVDYYLPLKVAELSNDCGVEKILVISSVGASKRGLSFYLRTKGEMEEAVSKAFKKKKIFVRPGLLIGEREDTRTAEKLTGSLMNAFSPLFMGGLAKYKAITAKKVASSSLALMNGKISPNELDLQCEIVL